MSTWASPGQVFERRGCLIGVEGQMCEAKAAARGAGGVVYVPWLTAGVSKVGQCEQFCRIALSKTRHFYCGQPSHGEAAFGWLAW